MSDKDSSERAWPTAAGLRSLRSKLLAWFARAARDLPWRRTRDPYAVWVSEAMLQQTQVATVKPYYERFLAELPDVAALAAAPERQVLRLWEGLGYYRRARQLHAAAREIVARHGGLLPRDSAALQALPGIGRYTAGAILSLAYDLPEPIVEANTQRLYCRLLAERGDPRSAAVQRRLWNFARDLLPERGAGQVNQALMELGALVCLQQPRCDACPLAGLCQARHAGLAAAIPPPPPRVRYEDVVEAAVVLRRRGKVLLRRCAGGERWAGLWDFPRCAVGTDDPARWADEIAAAVLRQTGARVALGERLATFKHGVTRYRITLHCHAAECLAPLPSLSRRDDLAWVAPGELESYPLCATGRKLARLVVRGG